MPTARDRLHELTDDQLETVLTFAEAIPKGREVVGVCDLTGTDIWSMDQLAGVVPTQRG